MLNIPTLKRLEKKSIEDYENRINKKCEVLESIRWISSAWNNDVKEITIKNCFNRCDFFARNANAYVLRVYACALHYSCSENLQDQVFPEDDDIAF